jgi:hypothetical protein
LKVPDNRCAISGMTIQIRARAMSPGPVLL